MLHLAYMDLITIIDHLPMDVPINSVPDDASDASSRASTPGEVPDSDLLPDYMRTIGRFGLRHVLTDLLSTAGT